MTYKQSAVAGVSLLDRRLSGHDGTVDGSPRKEKSALARFLLTPTAGSDETRNWGETERELLLRTDAEVVIGCWSQSAPDMCDSHTRTR